MPILPPPVAACIGAPFRLHSGSFAGGACNAITDVRGVRVNHVTVARSGDVLDGATVVLPTHDPWSEKAEAATYTINGNGALTNSDWIAESAHIETPIVISGNTLGVGAAYDGTIRAMMRAHPQIGAEDDVPLPVVAEIDGQRLGRAWALAVRSEDVERMILTARDGDFARGSVGAGAAATSFQYKAGIGSASCVLPKSLGGYTVGVLVDSNTGLRGQLRIHGVPVGALLPRNDLPQHVRNVARSTGRASDGSIIIVVATDAPLNARQLRALAKRAGFGLARTGSVSRVSSGDQVIAFSTGRVTHVDVHGDLVAPVAKLIEDEEVLDQLYVAAADATEDAIDDALLSAQSVTSNGWTVSRLPVSQLLEILKHPPAAL